MEEKQQIIKEERQRQRKPNYRFINKFGEQRRNKKEEKKGLRQTRTKE